MAGQRLFQRGQHRPALLAQRRQIAPNAAKGLSAEHTAETARDLLLHFDHPDIALGQAIVKGHREIVQEGEHGLLVLAEAIEETLVLPTVCVGLFCWLRVADPADWPDSLLAARRHTALSSPVIVFSAKPHDQYVYRMS
jgi:hypothetical protein